MATDLLTIPADIWLLSEGGHMRLSLLGRLIGPTLVVLSILIAPIGTYAQEPSTGDLFGDLYEIKRDAVTGQPILQQRQVLLPGDVPGIAYCPIAIDAAGEEIPFAPDSCEIDPTQLGRVVEIDYFGRLNAARTKERNQRMHFNEVISNIKAAEVVTVDEAGRMKLGSTCDAGGVCAEWATIDSPMENLALYNRVLKYGHIQTDPLEVDTTSGGDPNQGIQSLPGPGRGRLGEVPRPPAEHAAEGQCQSVLHGPGAANFVAECADPQALVDARLHHRQLVPWRRGRQAQHHHDRRGAIRQSLPEDPDCHG